MTQPDKRFFIIITAIFAVILFLVQLFYSQIPFAYSAMLWAGFSGFSILFSDNGEHRTRLIVISILAGLLASFINYYPSVPDWVGFGIMKMIASLAILCFIQVWHRANSFNAPYTKYYEAVWGNISLLILMSIFVGLCSLIVGLLSFLLMVVRLHALANFFEYAAVYFTFALIGLYISLKIDTVTCALQKVLVMFSQVLLPILAVIGFLYAVLWVIATPEMPRNSVELMSFVFPTLAFFGIIFINAAYEQGGRFEHFNKWYRASVPLLCLATLLLGGASAVRHHNSLQVAGVGLVMAYALVYLICSLTQFKTLSWLGKANIWLAVLLVFVAFDLTVARLMHPLPKSTAWKSSAKTKIASVLPKTLASAHIAWKTQKTSKFVFGYRKGQALTFCRVKAAGQWSVGELANGVCRYFVDKKAKSSSNYQVFTGSGTLTFDPIYTGKNRYIEVPGHLCRMIVNNRIYLGRSANYRCTVVADGKVVSSRVYMRYLAALLADDSARKP